MCCRFLEDSPVYGEVWVYNPEEDIWEKRYI